MNKEKILSLILFFFATLGLIDASYLTYVRVMKMQIPCSVSIFSGCNEVAQSSYSILFGIPLSVYGQVFYASIIILSLIFLYTGKEIARKLILIASLLGLLSSVYFIYIQGFIIKAFCVYCVFSAFSSIVLATTATILYKNKK